MNPLKVLSLSSAVFILAWGFDVAKEDFKTKKIPNKKILTAIKVSFVLLLAYAFNSVSGYYGATTNYLSPVFMWYLAANFLLALVGGYVLWYGEIWPAGDAKFFIMITAMIPFANPSAAGFPWYLWLSMLINIFFIAGIYSFARFLYESYRMKLAGDNDAFKELKEFKEKIVSFFALNSAKKTSLKIMNLFFSVFVIFLIKQALNMYMMGLLGRLFSKAYIVYFLLFFMWEKAGKMFEKKYWKIAMYLAYALYFSFGFFYFREELLSHTGRALSNVFKFTVILTIGRFVMEYIIEKKSSYWVGAAELEPGMVLSSKSIKEIRSNEEIKEAFEDYYKDGLDENHVKTLKEWLPKIPKENAKLEMVKGYPFALWIYLAFLVEIIFNKNVLTVFRL